jgi:CelD/BcsL family acetyltransferase involved in cellulose biosynthesis
MVARGFLNTAGMSLTVRELDGPDALARCAADFDRLSVASGSPVTSRRPWLQAWVDCYPDWQPWLVLVEDDGELVAVAPLARRRRGGLEQVVGLGHGPTDHLRLPARDDAAADALAAAVGTRLGSRWTLRVEQLPCADPVVERIVSLLRARGAVAELRSGEGMPTVEVTSRDLNSYLSKNTRKALAKIANRLERDGLQPDLRWTREPAQVRALLPELAAVHRARDEALGRRSDHADQRAARFYAEVIGRHADRGEVDLLTVRLRGELAAFVCGFTDGTALRSWDNRLAPAWSSYSAGRIANTEALRHVVASPDYDELDWMQGEEPYKLQSATQVVPTTDLYAWSSPAVRQAYGVVERLRDAKRSSAALTRLWWLLADGRSRASGARRR